MDISIRNEPKTRRKSKLPSNKAKRACGFSGKGVLDCTTTPARNQGVLDS
jgi:hypothetical protein